MAREIYNRPDTEEDNRDEQMEEYLLDLDYRLTIIELGGNEHDL